jgi:hypothetical protein
MIVGYKGVKKQQAPTDPDLGYTNEVNEYLSIFTGNAIVDGERVSGHVPNKIGSLVEMPRNEVTFDPAVGCSYGLHVGTWDYANNFGRGGVLEVHVNPRDVVSVPTDSSWAKMRVCRYRVVGVTEVPYQSALADDWQDDNYYKEEDDEYCPDCGEELDSIDGYCYSCDRDQF